MGTSDGHRIIGNTAARLVPEPSSAGLMASAAAVLGLATARRSRRRPAA